MFKLVFGVSAFIALLLVAYLYKAISTYVNYRKSMKNRDYAFVFWNNDVSYYELYDGQKRKTRVATYTCNKESWVILISKATWDDEVEE